MRTVAAAFLLVVATTSVAMPPQDIGIEADETQLLRQSDFIRLLTHVNEPLIWEDMANIAKEYKIQPQNYKVPRVADEYLQMERNGALLPAEAPVSILDEHHVTQIKVLFDLLYHAKDYEVFYKTALYLRQRANIELFLPAFYMAAPMHDDTYNIVLPPIYDVYPQLYFTSDSIRKVYDAKMRSANQSNVIQQFVRASYTGYPTAHTPEQKTSYFTEDVGLNEFLAQFFYRYPYFLSSANYTIANDDFRGKIFYLTIRQVLARYNLERLSNGLPEVSPVDYENPIKTGYQPHLTMQNGIEFTGRPANVKLRDVDAVTLQRIRNADHRINDLIESGYVISENTTRAKLDYFEATNILGNLVQSTEDSVHPRYYGAFFRDLLSIFAKSSDVTHKYGIASSVLGKYETMARNPVFFQILKRILNIFQKHQDSLEPYKKEEIEFPGIKIDNVDVDRLVTYFDDYSFDADNLLKENNAQDAERTTFFLLQPRLNHMVYTVRINVTSEKSVEAVFRVFLGPRLDAYGNEIPIDVARHNFVECDRFVEKVPAGQTQITRSSLDSPVLRHDPLSSSALLELVRKAQDGQRPFKPFGLLGYGFPDRLALPRGTSSGLPLRLYVIATPLDYQSPASTIEKDLEIDVEFGGSFREWYTRWADGQPVGFPFDRRIPHSFNFHVNNSYMRDVVVYHKTVEEIQNLAA